MLCCNKRPASDCMLLENWCQTRMWTSLSLECIHKYLIWRFVCQKQVSRAGTSNYTPHTLLLAPKFFYIYIFVCVCVQGVWMVLSTLQYNPRNMHTVFALLGFVVVIHWLIFPYPSGLLHWHCGNLTIAPVPEKQPWWIWINTSCEFIMNDCITTTKQSTTKPCAYFLGYTVVYFEHDYRLACPHHLNKDQSVYAPSLNFKYEQICITWMENENANW